MGLSRKLIFALVCFASAATAQTCVFTLKPATATAPAQGGDSFFDVSVGSSDCTRTAMSTVDWITVSFGQTGSGNGRIGYTVKPNTLGQSRQGSIIAGGQVFTVTQDAAICSFSFTPASQSVLAAGGSFTIKVATTCAWTATASDPWIAIAQPASATGNGSVTFNIPANTAAASRNGSITIGSKPIPVSQAGVGCTPTLSSASVTVPAAGQSGMFTFTVASGCAVTATSDSSWITAAVSGSTVTYAAAANIGTQPRSGSILIGGLAFTIMQAGGTCTYAISPVTVALQASGGAGRVDVTTGAGCPWTVQNNATFATGVTATATSGPGSVTFTVGPNTEPAARTGTLSIAGLTATISQAAQGVAISPNGIVNGASFIPGPVSPGEILSIFGSNLGPATPVAYQLSSDGQFFTTSLAGTRVLFDGTPAPMIFTLSGQASAIAPYSIAGNATTQVQVEYQGVRSDPVTVNVAASAPALFSLDSSGKGPGAILNQDFSVNSASNPALAGSIVMIYATGEGQTDPPGVDGKLTGTTLPAPLQRVSVQIAGQDAQVLYAGGAPGLVAGVVQVNVQIPLGLSGSALPVTLRVGSGVSPSTVTVAVQ